MPVELCRNVTQASGEKRLEANQAVDSVGSDMVITVPAASQSDYGLRPIDVRRDIPQVVELLRLVFGNSLDSDERQAFGDMGSRPDILWRLDAAASRLTQGYVWLADGRVVGNLTLLPTKVFGRYLVANVAVHPAYRRQGIARGLMDAAADEVRAKQGRVILLQVVKDNVGAVRLYESLGYRNLGNVTTWGVNHSRIRQITPAHTVEEMPDIVPLPARRWREAYDLDVLALPADLNWPEPLAPDVYRQTLLRRIGQLFGGQQFESWIVRGQQRQLVGLAVIEREWSRAHHLRLRVHPEWRGSLERPLLAKLIRRMAYLPRRAVRVDHPENDQLVTELLREANFTSHRTLSYMRLDL